MPLDAIMSSTVLIGQMKRTAHVRKYLSLFSVFLCLKLLYILHLKYFCDWKSSFDFVYSNVINLRFINKSGTLFYPYCIDFIYSNVVNSRFINKQAKLYFVHTPKTTNKAFLFASPAVIYCPEGSYKCGNGRCAVKSDDCRQTSFSELSTNIYSPSTAYSINPQKTETIDSTTIADLETMFSVHPTTVRKHFELQSSHTTHQTNTEITTSHENTGMQSDTQRTLNHSDSAIEGNVIFL